MSTNDNAAMGYVIAWMDDRQSYRPGMESDLECVFVARLS